MNLVYLSQNFKHCLLRSVYDKIEQSKEIKHVLDNEDIKTQVTHTSFDNTPPVVTLLSITGNFSRLQVIPIQLLSSFVFRSNALYFGKYCC